MPLPAKNGLWRDREWPIFSLHGLLQHVASQKEATEGGGERHNVMSGYMVKYMIYLLNGVINPWHLLYTLKKFITLHCSNEKAAHALKTLKKAMRRF